MPSTCSDLIGLKYRLGADGSAGEIDCIHLCYRVQERLAIPMPEFDPGWYSASATKVLRDLLRWGTRVAAPTYDGDIVLLVQDNWAFAVTWQTGVLYINRELGKVAWCRPERLGPYHCFRTKGS